MKRTYTHAVVDTNVGGGIAISRHTNADLAYKKIDWLYANGYARCVLKGNYQVVKLDRTTCRKYNIKQQ